MSFPSPTLNILFVNDPVKSSAFYSHLFGYDPLEQSATFAMFAFPNGSTLGLWSRVTAEPSVLGIPGGSELCFSDENVDQL